MAAGHPRPIRSFVLRQGRISSAQARALDELWPHYGVSYVETPLDLERLFGRIAPKILEIGFGMGEATAQIASVHPENDYLGVEVHGPGVGSLLKQVAAEGLANVRVIRHDAMDVLCHMLVPSGLDGVHIFFPDPWHKKRHHKRRLIQPALVSLLADRLKPGGYVHVATDWQNYAEHILAAFTAEPKLVNAAANYAPRPDYRPQTKFEQRGLRLGHDVWDMVFHRG